MKRQKKSIAAFLDLLDEPAAPTPPAVKSKPVRKTSKQQWLEENAPQALGEPPIPIQLYQKIAPEATQDIKPANGRVPFEPLPVRPDHIPKKHPPGTFKRGDVCFYRGERMWVEYAPSDWSQGIYARITDQRVHPDAERMSNDDKRLTFCVHVDCLEVAPQPKNPYAPAPTVASVARAERAKAGIKDTGDPTAVLLRSATTIDELYKIGTKVLGVPVKELKDKYSHLNPGQQRMNIGNRMRAKYKKEFRHG